MSRIPSENPAPTTIDNDLLLRALRGEPIERRPVWMMRQAGRYLPEYRAIRAETSFLELCRSPDLAAEVTVQPVDIVGVDAAIIFSDILVIPEAMGMHLVMTEVKGPQFPDPITAIDDIDQLASGVTGDLSYVYDAVSATASRLAARPGGSVPVIGFAGAPQTLAAYMIEGGGSKTFNTFKSFVYREPEATHRLFARLADELVAYLVAKVDAGARMLQLFDTWAGLLPEAWYQEFGLRHAQTVLEGVRAERPDVPILYFPKGVRSHADLVASGADGFGIDWLSDLSRILEEIPASMPIQGNLDPAILLSSPERIVEETNRMLAKVPASRRYIANLGHGIDKMTPVENARLFIDTVKAARLPEA